MCNYCWFKQVSLDSKTLFFGQWSQANCICQPSPPTLSHNNTLITFELPTIANAGVNNNKVLSFSTKPTLHVFWYYCPPGARRRRFFRSSKLQFHLFHWNSRSHSCNPFSIPFFIAVWSPGTLRQSFLWLEESPGAFRHHGLTRAGLFAVQSLLWVKTRHSLFHDFVGYSFLRCAPLANILSILLWNPELN